MPPFSDLPRAPPLCLLEPVPDPAEGDGQPLAQERVRVLQVLQAHGDQVLLLGLLLAVLEVVHQRRQDEGGGDAVPALQALVLKTSIGRVMLQ